MAMPTPPLTPPPAATAPAISMSSEHIVPMLSLDAASSDLIIHVDKLLEIYLENLDEYSKLREQLSKDFSNGFFSLAHANKTTTTGRRYGEESYDERIKAGRRVKINVPESKPKEMSQHIKQKTEEAAEPQIPPAKDELDFGNELDQFEVISVFPPKLSKSTKAKENSEEQDKDTHATTPKSPNSKSEAETIDSKGDDDSSSPKKDDLQPPITPFSKTRTNSARKAKPDKHDKEEEEQEKIKDPILQFGILSPPSLRASQNSFTSAVSETIPEMLNVINRLRWLEVEITKYRSRIDSSSTQ